MGFQINLGDLRGDLDLPKCLATWVRVVLGGANDTGLLADARGLGEVGFEHSSNRAVDCDVDQVADLEIMQVLGLFAHLDRHLRVLRPCHRNDALIEVNGKDFGIHHILSGDSVDQLLFCLHRETGCRQK
ncbi:hypothetical protein D9M71_627490 [compost metagenome]